MWDEKGGNRQKTHLQPLVEDDLLPLEADVFGPLDEAGQVLLGRDVTACERGGPRAGSAGCISVTMSMGPTNAKVL